LILLRGVAFRISASSHIDDRAGLDTVILLGTDGIAGALVVILECRHIKAVDDIRTYPELSLEQRYGGGEF